MNDEYDYAREDLINSLYNEFAEDVLAGKDELHWEIISRFVEERLQSYYLANADVIRQASWALDEARSLSLHPSASLVFSIAAAEIAVKAGLVKPLLYGLVHDPEMARFVSRLIPRQNTSELRNLLFRFLLVYGDVDLQTYKCSHKVTTLWGELGLLQETRNRVVHRGEPSTSEQADSAIQVATTIIDEVFPHVVRNLGLQIDHLGHIHPLSKGTQ